MKVKDIAWAAGFLEGEACFSFNGTPGVYANQVSREPLDRLRELFGGTIAWCKAQREGWSAQWNWFITGKRAAGLMMTVYALMSSRRQARITEHLNRWRASPGYGAFNRSKTHCRNGHEYTEANTIKWRNERVCRTCRRETKQRYNRKRKAA